MTERKHTPGSWGFDWCSDDSLYYVYADYEVEGYQPVICEIVSSGSFIKDGGYAEANAHLTAAGPDMLEALLQIESCAYTMAALDDETASLIISAIDKATGETQ